MISLIEFDTNKTFIDAIEKSYIYYNEKIYSTNDTRIKIKNKFILIYNSPVTDTKPDMFWHLAGWEKEQVSSIPRYNLCKSNQNWIDICDYNCKNISTVVKTKFFGNRYICLYRMSLLPMILHIISLINNNDFSNLTYWDEQKKTKKCINEQLYIRYQKDKLDYVLILQYIFEKDNKTIDKFVLVGAFPVIFKPKKIILDKMYSKNKEDAKIKQVLSI